MKQKLELPLRWVEDEVGGTVVTSGHTNWFVKGRNLTPLIGEVKVWKGLVRYAILLEDKFLCKNFLSAFPAII